MISLGVLLSVADSKFCVFDILLGGSFPKSSASNYGARSSTWSCCGAEPDSGNTWRLLVQSNILVVIFSWCKPYSLWGRECL
jgi:hypothetical protein